MPECFSRASSSWLRSLMTFGNIRFEGAKTFEDGIVEEMINALTYKIRKAFSDAADQYDILTSLHKEIGRELVKKNVKLSADKILDVGCGTGYAANKAKFFFPESTIVGLDIAEGMLRKAQSLHEGIPLQWILADAKDLPFKDECFGLVLSNLAYQWVFNLEQSFCEVRRVLKPRGVFNATMFGSRTGEELFASLQSANPHFHVRKTFNIDDVNKTMRMAGFQDIKVDFELIKVEFRDIYELLNWMKDIGANNLGDEKTFLGKDMLVRANECYRQRYPYNEGISASFEVIWVYGRR